MHFILCCMAAESMYRCSSTLGNSPHAGYNVQTQLKQEIRAPITHPFCGLSSPDAAIIMVRHGVRWLPLTSGALNRRCVSSASSLISLCKRQTWRSAARASEHAVDIAGEAASAAPSNLPSRAADGPCICGACLEQPQLKLLASLHDAAGKPNTTTCCGQVGTSIRQGCTGPQGDPSV